MLLAQIAFDNPGNLIFGLLMTTTENQIELDLISKLGDLK